MMMFSFESEMFDFCVNGLYRFITTKQVLKHEKTFKL